MTRAEMLEELRNLEGAWEWDKKPGHKQRVRKLAEMICLCVCRSCGKNYDNRKARGDYKGFCSAKCQHEKAKKLGFRKGKGRHEYDVLKRHGQIGDVPVHK